MTAEQIKKIADMTQQRRTNYFIQYGREHGLNEMKEIQRQVQEYQQRSKTQGDEK